MHSYIAVYPFFVLCHSCKVESISGQGDSQLAWSHHLLICSANKSGARYA